MLNLSIKTILLIVILTILNILLLVFPLNPVIIKVVILTISYLIFGIIIYNMIILPIKNLEQKSKAFNEGGISSGFEIKRKDEIEKLAYSFNQMATSVQQKIIQAENQNKSMLFELKMAAAIQKTIYPKLRENDRFKLVVYHNPMIEVSGDYHDVIDLGDNKYGFLIADVSGHSIAAALITMRIKEIVGNAAYKFNNTKDLIMHINSEFENMLEEYERFFTAFYIILNENNEVIYTNAAHPKALLLRSDQKEISKLDTNGCIIGLSKVNNIMYDSKSTSLNPGDKLILLTDGITESINNDGEEYGVERLYSLLKKNVALPCDEILKVILADYHDFVDINKRKDDETIMIIEIKKASS